jgi:hypothetical protein
MITSPMKIISVDIITWICTHSLPWRIILRIDSFLSFGLALVRKDQPIYNIFSPLLVLSTASLLHIYIYQQETGRRCCCCRIAIRRWILTNDQTRGWSKKQKHVVLVVLQPRMPQITARYYYSSVSQNFVAVLRLSSAAPAPQPPFQNISFCHVVCSCNLNYNIP